MSEHYKYIRAIVQDGKLRWECHLKDSPRPGRDAHDEDVSGWSDKDIIQLTRQVLSVEEDDPVEIEVQYH